MTSLDDLLSQDDESRRERSWAGRNARRGLIVAAISGALAGAAVLALDLVGYHLPYPVAFAGFFALGVMFLAVRTLRVVRPRRLGGRPEVAEDPIPPDGLAQATKRWQARLTGDAKVSRAALAELVDDRLRRRRGLTLDADPDRVRELLGKRLWTYLSDPGARTPSARDLAAMLTYVEKL